MIIVKVKTLDSQNHEFSVSDEITVKEFKEHIAEKVNIAADLQRLIYCGRVLNDDKPIKEYDVNGKCLHLVQRAPPNSTGSSSGSNDNFGTRNVTARPVNMGDLADIENIMMGSFSIPMAGNIVGPHTTTSLNPSSTLCGNRITVARHMLQCADNIAAYLENPENGLNNQNMDLLAQQTMESTVLEVGISAVTDADLPQQDVQNIVQAFQGAVSAAFRQNGINNITVQQNDSSPGIQVVGTIPSGMTPQSANTTSASSSITIEFPSNNSSSSSDSASTGDPQTPNSRTSGPAGSASSRQQTTSTQILGDVVGQMRAVQTRLDPFIQQYHDILQNDPTYPDDAAIESAQRIFDRVSEGLHYLSHAQHAISDLMLDLSIESPRHLCCRPILVEQSAFVSSGISAPTAVGVGSINIGPIFARGNMTASGGTNNNNNSSSVNNNDQQNGQNANSFASSLLSAFGLATSQQQQQPQPANPQPTTNSQQTPANPQPANASAGSTAQNPQDQTNRDRVNMINRRILSQFTNLGPENMNIINAAMINAGGQVNRGATTEQSGNQQTASTQQSTNATNTTATSTTASAGATTQNQPGLTNQDRVNPVNRTFFMSNAPQVNRGASTEQTTNADPAQARVNSNTQPTTSTQTRSTSRPILTSTTLPPTSIRNFRPIPANILSSFDRFLPCNSHHIRDNNLNQQQQNQQTQTIHIRPVRRAVSLDRNSMRPTPATTQIHVPAHMHVGSRFQNTGPPLPPRGRRIIDGVNNITESELNHRFSLFGIQFSLRDLDNLAPSFYNAQRTDLRSFLRQNYFINREINDETVSVAIRDMLVGMDCYLLRLNNFTHQDYDVRKSIENLIIKSLPFIINLITDDESNEFGGRFERQLVTFCENVYMILVKCIGIRDTEKFLTEIANEVMIGRTENVGTLGRFSRHIIQKFLIERRSYDLSEIQEFLIIKRPSAPTPIVVNDESNAMEVDEPQPVSAMIVETEDDDSNSIQVTDILFDPLPPIDRAEPWHAQFSPDWLPIITRDVIRQQRQTPQRPYSDVYISGMSSKRRKILQSRKPPSNVQQLVADNVRQVLSSTKKPTTSAGSSRSLPPNDEIVSAISNDPAVLSAYREEIKSNISQRLKSDPDKDDEKHPNSSKAFK